MARSYEVNDVRESRMNKGHQTSNQNSCGDCGKPIKGTGSLCKECREDFTDIIGGVK